MRTIFVLFDSLNRGNPRCYGSDLMETPHFSAWRSARSCS